MVRSRSLRTRVIGAAAATLVVVAAAGCSSGGSGGGSADASPTTPAGKPATVGITNTSLGNILDNAQGRTLYLFKKDSGTTSACTGACTTFWPPLTATGTPIAGSGASSSLLGTTKRSDGSSQVTYNGHPVYTYTGDHNTGDTTGEGLVAFGGAWYALDAAGNQVTASGSSSSSGGGGLGY